MMKKLMMITMISGLIFTTSCEKSIVGPKTGLNNCTYLSYVDVFNSEFSEWQTAITNYTNNQSTENCEAYKDATTDYLSALRAWEDCARELNFLNELEESIDDAIAETEELDC